MFSDIYYVGLSLIMIYPVHWIYYDHLLYFSTIYRGLVLQYTIIKSKMMNIFKL